MRTITCDKCGCLVSREESLFRIRIEHYDIGKTGITGKLGATLEDVCQKCTEEVISCRLVTPLPR